MSPCEDRNTLTYHYLTCIVGRREVVQEVQVGLRRCSGQELPHQLPRHEPDHRQVEVHGQEVADPH